MNSGAMIGLQSRRRLRVTTNGQAFSVDPMASPAPDIDVVRSPSTWRWGVPQGGRLTPLLYHRASPSKLPHPGSSRHHRGSVATRDLRYVRWLEEMVRTRLFYRVGGGYEFVHVLLRDHL